MRKYRLFFDFEFEPKTKAPISFGLIGKGLNQTIQSLPCSIYHEFNFDRSKIKSTFLEDTVFPLLGLPEGQALINKSDFGQVLSEQLIELCAASGVRDEEVVLVCDSEFDKDMFHQLSGNLFPVEIVKFDNFEEERDFEEVYDGSFDEISSPRHHALADANALMNAYISMKQSKQPMKARSFN